MKTSHQYKEALNELVYGENYLMRMVIICTPHAHLHYIGD